MADRCGCEASATVVLQYCQQHYDEISMALVERQMGDLIARSEEELIAQLESGNMDPLLEASNGITSAAISMFGPGAILESGGCPVCCFHNIISHVADHLAVKYKASN